MESLEESVKDKPLLTFKERLAKCNTPDKIVENIIFAGALGVAAPLLDHFKGGGLGLEEMFYQGVEFFVYIYAAVSVGNPVARYGMDRIYNAGKKIYDSIKRK